MFKNLEKEMELRGITYKKMANFIGLKPERLKKEIEAQKILFGDFIKIRDEFFPDINIDYLLDRTTKKERIYY